MIFVWATYKASREKIFNLSYDISRLLDLCQ